MKPMLAGPYVAKKIEEQLPVYGQPKLDGIRMFIRDGVAYTRSLKPVRSEFVQQLVEEAGVILNGLDGEIIAGDPTAEDAYRRTNSSVMSYSKPDDLTFYVFDRWDSEDKFSERLSKMKQESNNWPSWVKLLSTQLLSSMDEILEYEGELLADGHEGVILRSPDSYYKFGRSSANSGELVKMKRFIDTEARITGFVEFFHNSNTAVINELGYTERSSHKENLIPMDTLGAILATGVFPDGTKYKVRIGTGFDTATRKEVWDNREEYLGKMVKFSYFPTGVKSAPRFPVFLGFRDADDLNSSEPKEELKQGELF